MSTHVGTTTLTPEAGKPTPAQSLQELKDLQGELELGALQQALHKMEQGNMTSEVAKSAKESAEKAEKVNEGKLLPLGLKEVAKPHKSYGSHN